MGDDRDPRDGGRSERGRDPARRIVAAARELIGQRGFERTRISDIAAAARVARGAIFYYFGTKEHLAAEVLRADAEERLESFRRNLADARTLDELLRGMVAELANFTDAEQASHVFAQQIDGAALSSEELRAVRQEVRARCRQGLTDILREKERGGIIRLPADPAVVGTVLTSLGHGIANESISDPDWDLRGVITLGEQLVRLMLGHGQPLSPV